MARDYSIYLEIFLIWWFVQWSLNHQIKFHIKFSVHMVHSKISTCYCWILFFHNVQNWMHWVIRRLTSCRNQVIQLHNIIMKYNYSGSYQFFRRWFIYRKCWKPSIVDPWVVIVHTTMYILLQRNECFRQLPIIVTQAIH